MSQTSVAANPFALMIAPEAIFAAIERSERLARLKSTVCHPLDKPRAQPTTELADFDERIDDIGLEPTGFGQI